MYCRPQGLGQTTTSVQQLIQNAAANYPNIPGLAAIAAAVAQHESGFQANAQNPGSSAAGIFQLTSSTQQTMGVTNPYDPTQNVDAGVALLAQYYQTYGSWPLALQAFSDGPGTVNAGMPPSAQTNGLVSYVTAQVGSLSSLASSLDLTSGIDLSSLGIDLSQLDPTTVLLAAAAVGLAIALVI